MSKATTVGSVTGFPVFESPVGFWHFDISGITVTQHNRGILVIHTGILAVQKGILVVHTGILMVQKGTLVIHTGILVVHKGILVVHIGILEDILAWGTQVALISGAGICLCCCLKLPLLGYF
jgi:hypothetical protein